MCLWGAGASGDSAETGLHLPRGKTLEAVKSLVSQIRTNRPDLLSLLLRTHQRISEINLSHYVPAAAPTFSDRGAGHLRIAGSLPAPTPAPTWVSSFGTFTAAVCCSGSGKNHERQVHFILGWHCLCLLSPA